ncbi:MAG: hypothetical protein ACE5H0_03180 [Bacteroidota bacterium]
MTIEELEERRAQKWRRRPELALDTEEEMLRFIDEMGFCLIGYRKNAPLPSLVHAIEDIASPRRSLEVNALLKSFLEAYRPKKKVLEWNSFLHSLSVISSSYLPLFYALIGDRRPDRDYRKQFKEKKLTLFEVRVYEAILEEEPISWKGLRLALNAWQEKQAAMLKQSLWRLWKGLKIVRVGFWNREGSLWQSTCSWDKRLLARSSAWTREEALQRLILHYVEIADATSRRQIKKVFHGLADSSAINAAVNQLYLACRLDVDPSLVLNGKKAIICKVR